MDPTSEVRCRKLGVQNVVFEADGPYGKLCLLDFCTDSRCSYRSRLQCPVPELRRLLEAETGVGIAVQRLIHRGQILQDDKTVADYGVKDGHSLHMVERPPDIPAVSERAGEREYPAEG